MARLLLLVTTAFVLLSVSARGEQVAPPRGETSYLPVDQKEPFAKVMDRMKGQKAKILSRQAALLRERYDLGNRPAKGIAMTRGKPIQEGVRAKLPQGTTTWDALAAMSPEQIREKNLFP